MQHVFIIGSKGIPANYGGYETFVEKLTENQVSHDIKYHVACAVDSAEQVGEFEHNGAHCFNVLRRPVGAARAIFYDIDASSGASPISRRTGSSTPSSTCWPVASGHSSAGT